MEFGLKCVRLARYGLILKQDGAIWLRIISKPLLNPEGPIKDPKNQKRKWEMIPAWTPNNSISRNWARRVCTKLVTGWVRAHCGARHQSMGHHHRASSWGIYTDSWGIIIWSMSMHKRQRNAACKNATSNCSSERPSHVVFHVHVIGTLLWTLHWSYMIVWIASGYIHRFHGHTCLMYSLMDECSVQC